MSAALRPIFDDVAVQRRYLVGFGFVQRPEPGVHVIPGQPQAVSPPGEEPSQDRHRKMLASDALSGVSRGHFAVSTISPVQPRLKRL